MLKKRISKIIMIALSVTMLYNYSGFSVKAMSESTNEAYNISNKVQDNTFDLVKNEDNYIEYVIKEDGKKLIYKENFSNNGVNSKVYIIKEDGTQEFYKSINSIFTDTGVVKSEEIFSNGIVEKSELVANADGFAESNNALEDDGISTQNIMSVANRKKYLRTDKRGISLVGKKVSIGAAAGAISLACPGIALAFAKTIIVKAIAIMAGAIAGGIGAGVSVLPDYIYETRKVYRTGGGVGKIYTRYDGKFYLDSARRQYIGAFTYSRRGFH
ncbi:hypothetical protein [Peptostreptococcus porci]|uniref:hypothetical protein n=1 Tax=Peptostreptococcus porci TaxID=2652282 RepID=UPI002A75176A|nr:hypothetical protein [Peptostreptococcus porci]MDY2793682.1 hypothetical protein [Peptostreptococcus porci]